MKRIFICVVCVIALLLGIAIAEEVTVIASGECGKDGDNVIWGLDSAGTLTISGDGEMKDYEWDSNSPWYSYRQSIRIVIVEDNVSSIGDCAFYDCDNIMNVSISDSVTIIGSEAFGSCYSLSSIELPKHLESINNDTFWGCENLYSIVIPNGVTSIGSYAFEHCYNLKNIIIPESVTYISAGAFAGCQSLIKIDLPNNIEYIGENTFCNCTRLRGINLPSGIIGIGRWAFENCSSLSSICIPNSVHFIGESAFAGCNNLLNVILPERLETIETYAFDGCKRLTSITIPDGINYIRDRAFNNCMSLQNIFFIGNKAPSIGIDAFYGDPIIYCRKDSDTADWAANNGYTCKYIEYKDMFTPASINLPEEMRVPIGKSKNVLLDIFPQTAEATIVWKSSDPSIISIEDGVMTAHSEGEVVITATCGELSDQMTVFAYIPIESFDLSETELWVCNGDTIILTIENIYPVGATAEFIWDCSNTWDMTVENGEIHIGKEVWDSVWVFVSTNDGIIRNCLVHVYSPVNNIELQDTQYQIGVNTDAQIIANVTTEIGKLINKLVTFSSSNENIATVDQAGCIRAVGPGTATITVTATSGVSATCTVEVLACNHNAVIDPAVPATHVTMGLTEGSHCSECGEILVEQNVIPMIDVKKVVLPTGLKTIEEEAFAGDTFVCVVLPDGCKTIESGAFRDCAHMRFVEIPETVTSIDDSAFDGCADDLIIVTASGSEAERFANSHNIICILYK